MNDSPYSNLQAGLAVSPRTQHQAVTDDQSVLSQQRIWYSGDVRAEHPHAPLLLRHAL
jgi:hypothetical protein